MATDTSFVLRYFEDLEELAEEVLTDKQQIVDLDKKRNQNREAIRALRNAAKSSKKEKAWVCLGTTFLKLPATQTQTLLEADQDKLDSEIDQLRRDLKQKVSKLRDMEGESEAKGFDLKAMSADEMKVFSR